MTNKLGELGIGYSLVFSWDRTNLREIFRFSRNFRGFMAERVVFISTLYLVTSRQQSHLTAKLKPSMMLWSRILGSLSAGSWELGQLGTRALGSISRTLWVVSVRESTSSLWPRRENGNLLSPSIQKHGIGLLYSFLIFQ